MTDSGNQGIRDAEREVLLEPEAPEQEGKQKEAEVSKPNALEGKFFKTLSRSFVLKSHVKARTRLPDTENDPDYQGDDIPARSEVPDGKVRWDIVYPEYNPSYYQARFLEGKSWADDEEITEERRNELIEKGSYEYAGKGDPKLRTVKAEMMFDEDGRPLNPRGRTGLTGRLLGKWGPNFAADSILTREDPETGVLQLLVIERANGELAIPGGMVDKNEKVSRTLIRELKEETNVDGDEIMKDAEIVYEGYVDDPRNTDNAWMETLAAHKHLNKEEGEKHGRFVRFGSDARGAFWVIIEPENINELYASHSSLVKMALCKFMEKNWNTVEPEVNRQVMEVLAA